MEDGYIKIGNSDCIELNIEDFYMGDGEVDNIERYEDEMGRVLTHLRPLLDKNNRVDENYLFSPRCNNITGQIIMYVVYKKVGFEKHMDFKTQLSNNRERISLKLPKPTEDLSLFMPMYPSVELVRFNLSEIHIPYGYCSLDLGFNFLKDLEVPSSIKSLYLAKNDIEELTVPPDIQSMVCDRNVYIQNLEELKEDVVIRMI